MKEYPNSGKTMGEIAKIELVIGYSFRNRNLLQQALTHKTYARSLNTPEFHNEWLALLGDTILDVIVMEHLFWTQTNDSTKGFLSDERDRLVADDNLVLLADQIQLRNFLRVMRESGEVNQKDVTDGFEALLGAIYLDITGFTTADEALDAVQVWFIDKFLGGHQSSDRATVSEKLPLPELEAAIGYSFQNKELLHQAIDTVTPVNFCGCHASLALLGDTLLDLVVLEYLHEHKGNHGKGLLSTLRDLLVQDSTLVIIAHQINLKEFIIYSGQPGLKNLTDSVEALLAAIYLDRGLLVARDWIFALFPPKIMSQVKKRLGQELANTQVLFGLAVSQRIAEMLTQDCLISSAGVNYERLHRSLRDGRWQEADEETKEAMLRAVGRMDYLPKDLIAEFPAEDLEIIDRLWVHYSGGRFGFSVQVEILQEVEENWGAFSERVGWQGQPKGDRIYELQAPRGHLPSAAIRVAGKGTVRMQILQRFAVCQDRFSDVNRF
jgi:dsRNA-specific ribonuclease